MGRTLVWWLVLGLYARNTGCLNTIDAFSPLSDAEFLAWQILRCSFQE